MNSLGKDLKDLEDGIEAFDAYLQEDIIVYAPILCVIGDNPRSSLLASHLISARANQFCRMCKVSAKNYKYIWDE